MELFDNRLLKELEINNSVGLKSWIGMQVWEKKFGDDANKTATWESMKTKKHLKMY